MPRYFLEVAYRGTRYSGFQVQENAPTIQSEIERAFHTIHRRGVQLTGSSRTDAGVHALQNFFHFDTEEVHAQFLYKMNAVLPDDIVIKGLHPVAAESHSRFHALSREYEYRLYRNKDPFRKGLAYYFPYKVEEALLAEAAALIQQQTGFLAFSKSNTQVKTFDCHIYKSTWEKREGEWVYMIKANRFLRGMVRMLTAVQLKVARGSISMQVLEDMFRTGKCPWSAPAEGLYLKEVAYPAGVWLTGL